MHDDNSPRYRSECRKRVFAGDLCRVRMELHGDDFCFLNCADVDLALFFPAEKRKKDELWATEPPQRGVGKLGG